MGTALHEAVVAAARRLMGFALSASGLVVACFMDIDIILPDDILALHRAGEKIVGSDLLPADLIFRTGRHDLYHAGDLRYGIGHVGIYTGIRTVVHVSPAAGCVSEDGIDVFIDAENGRFRGVRRIIAHP
jgi:cell wall-associated NlpC family hydrolase